MKGFGLLFRVILAIALGIILGSFVPEWMIRSFATFNDLFGIFLDFIIPLIILGFIAPGIGSLGRGAGKLLGLTGIIAYTSTIIAGLLAFIVAKVRLSPYNCVKERSSFMTHVTMFSTKKI